MRPSAAIRKGVKRQDPGLPGEPGFNRVGVLES